jgi:hypothetical protein
MELRLPSFRVGLLVFALTPAGCGDGSGDTVSPVTAMADDDGPVCEEASDCTLIDNCCTCSASADETPGECAESCERTRCEEWGITSSDLECYSRLGRSYCEIASAALPWCRAPYDVDVSEGCGSAPECDAESVPEADRDSGCWTGSCVPAELCRQVARCEQCGDELCLVIVRTGAGIQLVEGDEDLGFDRVHIGCVPRKPDCPETDCACAEDLCSDGDCSDGPLDEWPYSTGVGQLNERSRGGLVCKEWDG